MFCREYLKDLNATQAAIRAGYSANTARQISSENLTKPYLLDRIAQLRKEQEKEEGKVSFEMVLDFFLDKSKDSEKDADQLNSMKEVAKLMGYYEVHNKQKTPEKERTRKPIWNRGAIKIVDDE